MFKGYVSRDRRKAYVVEADRAADQLLSRAAASRELTQHAWLLEVSLLLLAGFVRIVVAALMARR